MKKLIIFIIMSSILQNCFYSVNKQEILRLVSVEVFFIPLGLYTPISKDEKTIRNIATPFTIQDNQSISKIDSLLNDLKEVYDSGFVEDIYMVCDLRYTDGSNSVLLYNNGRIKIGDNIYEESTELIETIISLKD